jgi:hypothetical protein
VEDASGLLVEEVGVIDDDQQTPITARRDDRRLERGRQPGQIDVGGRNTKSRS